MEITADLEKIVKRLDQFKSLIDYETVMNFEKAVGDLIASRNPLCISILLSYLDDECEYTEVMYTIIHAVEVFPDDIYIERILSTLPQTYDHSPEYMKIIFCRILNNPQSLNCLRQNIHLAPSTIKEVLADIASSSKNHQIICEELSRYIKD